METIVRKAFPDAKGYNSTQWQDLETDGAFINGLSLALKEFMLSLPQQPITIWDAVDKAQQKQTLLEQFYKSELRPRNDTRISPPSFKISNDNNTLRKQRNHGDSLI